jgi:hypothetical protein
MAADEYRRPERIEIFRLKRLQASRLDVQLLSRLRLRQTNALAASPQARPDADTDAAADAALAIAACFRCHSL